MKIAFLQIGKTTEKYISEGVEEYSARIRKYTSFDIFTIPDLKSTKNMPVTDQKVKEGKLIMQYLKNDDYLIVLDERGGEYTTKQLSGQMEKIFLLPKKRIVFVIGGPWGFADDIFRRADLRMSLSKLTFSHQLVRLLFAEQLYRVLTVIKGDPYHHD